MKRWLWLAFKIIGGIVAVLVAIIVALLVILRPPKPLAVPAQGVTLSGVTVVNPGIDRRAKQTLIVEGGSIRAISPNSSPDADARYAGAFVLPGLIDMHVHNPPPQSVGDLEYFFLMYLRRGVTTIRDTGNAGWMLAMRQRLLNGEVAGPRAFTCGPILDGDPPVWPFSIVVHNPAEADRAVAKLASQGADFVKVYERLTPEALHEIEAEARRRNLPIVGHVPELVRFEDAHEDDVQHLTGTVNRPQRIYTRHDLIMTERKGWHDLDDARIAFVIKTSLDQHITHTPTLIVLDRTQRADYDAQFNEPVAQLMPRWYQVFWRRPDFGFTTEEFSSLREWGDPLPKMKLMVRRMHEAGVPLHVGTDTLNPFVVPGAALHEEMRKFLECGFTPEQVWATSTRDNGASLPLRDLGMLKDGAPADFLIFKEDPVNDLSRLDTLEAVVANGRLYTREDLDAGLQRCRQRYASASRQWVMMTLMKVLAPRASAKPKPR